MATQIVNFGSLNIDYVYQMDHFVRPGETTACTHFSQFSGGKGFNQSVALARAGASVHHAGRIGADGVWLKQYLDRVGVDTTHVESCDTPTGHAIIQVNPSGENAIIIHGGANQTISPQYVRSVMSDFQEGDYLLLQNETSAIPDMINAGAQLGLVVVFNPAPMSGAVSDYPLDLVDTFILNEIEGEGLTGEKNPGEILRAMREHYPRASVILTRGASGAVYSGAGKTMEVPGVRVRAVDTTAAGDTFIGFFLAGITAGGAAPWALKMACHAAAACCTRPGAADSIPASEMLTDSLE